MSADLIARLEEASEGSRKLDVAIWDVVENWPVVTLNPDWRKAPNGADVHALTFAPDYTTSIDDALTLVPEGMRVRELGQWWDIYRPGGWFCAIMEWKRVGMALVEDTYSCGIPDDQTYKIPLTAPTPALALCIAAMKARSP
jgi:hypothetical protein